MLQFMSSKQADMTWGLENKAEWKYRDFHTPFPILCQSIVPCLVLTVVFWPAYKFLRKQVRWSGISISLRMFHRLLWYTPSKAVSMKHSQWSRSRFFFFWNSLYFFMIQWMLAIWYLAFCKSSLYISEFLVHLLLKPSLKDFDHNFSGMWNE